MSAYRPVYDRQDVTIVSRDTAFDGFFAIDRIVLRHRLFAGGWSNDINRELFRRDQAGGVLLYDPGADKLVLVEQFRVGLLDALDQSPWALELVAGIIDDGESAPAMALREAHEEAGLHIGEPQFICNYFNSPGGSTERISLLYAEVDAAQASGIHGMAEENEDIRVVVLSFDEAWQAFLSGRINNAMAIIALQWLRLKRAGIDATVVE
ncbi:NUDIX domain-containing protein [Pseudohongiella sp.]|uniref:ADP-ribose pyrophosphatase n=1 Tax=marine sediment metagenome TaxID=412755 RepID=A0A0F9YIA7_9ZZZZ|nr:NUDIX domain-containing protein [Pseudohongiella sp.]HDZ07870.1 NUDIX domain-containing protein [Pseudohongiella sp.]HEA61798.1 NUDIX domain-containing protein [Pseudohongiella sp.]